MRNPVERILLIGGVLALAAALAWTPSASAANVTFHLYGDNVNGWGFASGQQSIPGPQIAVDQGDNVTLVLTSTDGNTYRWYLDYNNNSARDANEPRSPNFAGNAVTWNFTANRPGTFTYRSQSDPSVMRGTFIVLNGTSTPPGAFPINLNSLVLVTGIVVAFVGAIAALALMARRKEEKSG